jgi:hypothetical protein
MSKPPGHILAAVMPGDPAASVKSIYLNRRSPTTCLIWRKEHRVQLKKQISSLSAQLLWYEAVDEQQSE